tara:strand:- start:170 stop:616 length:447 start_codon:yes stop_codon:yes gene_type:complete
MQKLAGLITESDIKKKLSLKENSTLAKAESGKPLTDEEKQELAKEPISVADLVADSKLHYLLRSLPELVKKYGIKFIPHRKPFKNADPVTVGLFLKYFKTPGLMKTEDLKGKWFYEEDDTTKKQIPGTAQNLKIDQGALEAALEMLKK